MSHVRIDAAPLTPARMVVRDVHLSPVMRVVSRMPAGQLVVAWAIRRELRAEATRSFGFNKSDEARAEDARARFSGISKHLA